MSNIILVVGFILVYLAGVTTGAVWKGYTYGRLIDRVLGEVAEVNDNAARVLDLD